MLRQRLANPGCSLRVFGYHIEIASTSGSGQLVAQAEVVDQVCYGLDGGRVRAAVEELVFLTSVPIASNRFWVMAS